MPYTVEILPDAIDEIQALPKKMRGQIGRKIDQLTQNAFPQTCTKLEGRNKAGVYRIPSGDYRILYTVIGNKVQVVRVGNRKDVYKGI